MDATSNPLPLLRAFAACHQLFKALGANVRARPGVTRVVHHFDVYNAADGGFRLTEYLSPDRTDGRWTCWRLEIAVAPDAAATVTADTLGDDPDGRRLRTVVAAAVHLAPPAAAEGIVAITRRLCAADPA
jgi:hypothetical protein